MSLQGACGDIFLCGFRGDVLGPGSQEVLAPCVCPGGQRGPITDKATWCGGGREDLRDSQITWPALAFV